MLQAGSRTETLCILSWVLSVRKGTGEAKDQELVFNDWKHSDCVLGSAYGTQKILYLLAIL